jgi:hypothetical protein
MRPCAFVVGKIHFQLVFEARLEEKAQYSTLNLEVKMHRNRDPCTHFYSFRKFTVQGKGQTFGASK